MDVKLPGGSVLATGRDDFVLKDFSFQQGSTSFLDWNGDGVRVILELRQLSDTGATELVLRYTTRTERMEQSLLALGGP